MSPFTGESIVIREILKGEHNIWKSLSGPIDSIRVLERKAKTKGPNDYWRIEIKTKRLDSSIKDNPPDFPACTGIYEVNATWDLMSLTGVQIKELSVKCEK